jgi:glycosyltransferase involved in cell wall biosynthesis
MGLNRRLHVSFPPSIAAYPYESGVGKIWHHVLSELSAGLDVLPTEPARRRLQWRRPDVWIHDGHQGPLPVRAPVVAELHEAAWSDPDTRMLLDPAFVATYEGPSREAALAATRIVTLSESSRRQITETYGVEPNRIHVATPGVDHAVFHPCPAGSKAVLARSGGDPARPYVVFVSQLHPRKNLAVLREAMARLVARGFPHALVLVGGPPLDRADGSAIERAATADLRGSRGRVLRLQRLTEPEVAEVIAGAAAFCLPSLMEGFGLSVLEAMACGVPVVVSNRGALPEVVGSAGISIEPTADAVEAALADLLTDDECARRLGAAGLARSSRFTWQATARQWRKAILEAAVK